MRRRILAMTSLAHFINDGCGIAYATSYPIYINRGYSYIDVSIASALYLGTSAISSIAVGRIGDSIRRPAILLGFGVALWSIAIFILGYSIMAIDTRRSLELLLISALVGGVASSIYHPIGASIVSRYFIEDLGLALGINGSMGALGRSSYPIIITLLLSITPAGLLPLAIASLVASISIIASIGGITQNTGSRYRTVSISREIALPIALLTVIAMMRGILSQGVITYLSTFINQKMGISYGVEVGLLTSLALAGSIVSQPFLGVLSDRLGRGRSMILTTIMGSVSIYGFLELYRYSLASYIFLFLFGVFAFEAFTLLLSFVSDIMPERYVSTANSIVWGLGLSAGGSIGPVIVGLIASSSSLEAGYMAIALLNLLTIPIILYVKQFSHVRLASPQP
jgi:MFS family permease